MMEEKDPVLWGIHAGKTGDADTLFQTKKRIALGWPMVGDLSSVPAKRDAFKALVAANCTWYKPGAIPVAAGQLYRFLHELQVGDYVLYRPKYGDKKIHLGRVTGTYRYDPSESNYPNQRTVEWLKAFPSTLFTQGALYEIGSAMSFFQIKNYADEFFAALNATKSTPVENLVPEDDTTVGAVAEEIQLSTRDFILKRLAQETKGHPFAEFISHLLGTMGFRTRVSPPGPDGGIDIVAHKDELGFEPPLVKVQVKSTQGSVGDPDVSALYGKVGTSEFGLLITLGTYTAKARSFGDSKTNLRLIDGDGLVELVLTHYDQFDARYKALIPLKRVYVPEE
jgi:restriction system protein